MKFAVLGNGGREHAIAWKLAQRNHEVFVLPGNGGTPGAVALDPLDFDAVASFCQERGVDLVVVGPEHLLAAGVVDALRAKGVAAFGPTAAAAQLEGSKVWSKMFMARHGVATAPFAVVEGCAGLMAAAARFDFSVAIKFDGLAAGKGVVVCSDRAEVEAAAADLEARFGASAKFVVEKAMAGWEVSLLVLTDGSVARPLAPAQDHKRLLDGDRGPNTGGMGAFCPVPRCDRVLQERIEKEIIAPTLRGIRAENLDFRGVLFFGVMVTQDGPKLLEYNVRFGDPETQVVLPALETDLGELLTACVNGHLTQCEVSFRPGYFVGVVLASQGYPTKNVTGMPIEGLENVDAAVFHAGTCRDGHGVVRVNGGRVLTVVGHGFSLVEARARAYAACERIGFQGMQLRRDIGVKGTEG